MVRRGINEMATFAHQTLLRLAHATVGIRASKDGLEHGRILRVTWTIDRRRLYANGCLIVNRRT
jgi:hypothetical protein